MRDPKSLRHRMRAGFAITAIVGLFTVVGHGQLAPPVSKAMIQSAGLDAIDRGLRDLDPPRPPRGKSSTAQIRPDRGDSLPYVRGSIIVKFRDGVSRGTSSALTAQVSGVIADRSSWADFDIVTIPDALDPEAASAALRERPDVEYAQPRYINHAMVHPNDSLYPNQWNFPAIDMERAWDIQPGATSNIIVAVLDSGMAYRTGTIRYNSRFGF